jgi:hypothetical protein
VIEAWDPEVIVPGHGPVTDLDGLREIRAYLEHCRSEARRCFDAGMDLAAAARELRHDRWAHWGEPERLVTMVDSCYREFRGTTERTPVAELFAAMAAAWSEAR